MAPKRYFNELERGVRDVGKSDVIYQKIEEKKHDYGGEDVGDGNEDGSVKSLSTKENGELEADLYVDCSGFRALLLSETLKVPFISFNDCLMNDKKRF